MPDLMEFIERAPDEPSSDTITNPVQLPGDGINVDEAVNSFINENNKVPSWFVTLLKTALNRNITLEDWNTLCSFVQKLSKDNYAFQKLITMLFENDELLKGYTDQEVADAVTYLVQHVADGYVPKTFTLNTHPLTGNSLDLTQGDVGLDKVSNVATNTVLDETKRGNNASTGAVLDYLNFSYIDENGNAKTISYEEAMKRVNLIWAVFRDEPDNLDNVVNTIVDMLNVLQSYPEAGNTANTANLIAARLDALEASTEDAFATIGPYYLVGSDYPVDPNDETYKKFTEQDNPEYDEYPFVACIENENLIGAKKVSVVYDVVGSGSDIVSSGVKVDITNGRLYIYAVESPAEPIKIEEIDIINNLKSYRLYNTAIEQMVIQDHARIENIEEALEDLPSGGGDLLYQHNVSYYAISMDSSSLHLQDIAFSFLSSNPEAMTGAQILAYLLATLPTNDVASESPHRNGLVASGKWAFNDSRDSIHEVYDAKCIAKVLENGQSQIVCRCLGVGDYNSNKVLVDNGFVLEETFTYDGQTVQTMEDKVSLTVPLS